MPRLSPRAGGRRYRRVAVTYTVARQHGAATWPTLSSPEAAAQFARELVAAHDDDRERFWVIFLNAQNGNTDHHLVSTGACRRPSSTRGESWAPPFATARRT